MLLAMPIAAWAAGAAPSFDGMNFHTFDQTESGWRSIQDPRRRAEVIDHYRETHPTGLTAADVALLYWHAGQAWAMARDTALAKARFRLAFHRVGAAANASGWNAHVRGTIAFLDKDRPALLAAIRELESARDASAVNLRILNHFAAQFRSTYAEAYATR